MPPFSPPTPPYVAVIFSSQLRDEVEGYAETADRMEELAAQQAGYLGVESVRDQDSGHGITVSYWRTEADAAAWKQQAEHLEAQRAGQERWYRTYVTHVATVTRSYRSAGRAVMPS